jgi:glycosyltransferase involved in cell wall biosynthesis
LKALIITYYWPPAGGSGVQRWLKFVKYLQDFNVEPVVYTIKNPKYPILDNTLKDQVPKNIKILRQPIWEPNNFLSIFKKDKSQSAGFLNPNPSFFGKILQYIRANYFIPDARKFWVKPSVKFLENYIKKNKIDVIITTGPPHSLHLIGLQLKEKLNIKWISDFRDPWTAIDYFHQLPLNKKAKEKHFQLEKKVLEKSDVVIVVGKTMKEEYLKFNKNIYVITNGFDSDITTNENVILDKRFSITHIGMMNADRNPKLLWEVLADICNENSEFKNDLKINLIGKLAPEVIEDLDVFKTNTIDIIDYLPHLEVRKYQQKSQLLLLMVNNVPSAKGIITGKIFEYLEAKRPILAIAPEDGDAAEIINTSNAGFVVDFKDASKLKAVILSNYKAFKKQALSVDSKNIHQYHRKELTKELAAIIKDI